MCNFCIRAYLTTWDIFHSGRNVMPFQNYGMFNISTITTTKWGIRDKTFFCYNINMNGITEHTSQISRKSCCSTRNNSHVVFVTTVLSRGKSVKTDSPNVAPTPRLQSVIGH